MSVVFTEDQLDRMGDDPVLARQYAWHLGQAAILRAVRMREERDLVGASLHGAFGRFILDNLDEIAPLPDASPDPLPSTKGIAAA